MIDQNFIYLAAAINFGGGLSYLLDTIKGKTRPNRATWIIWSLAPGLAFFGQVKNGVGLESLFTFTTFFLPMLILIASIRIKSAKWKLGRLDYTCLTLSLLGLVVFLVTGQGLVAIAAGITSDFIAAIPTLIKSYKFPKTENWIGFATGAVGAIITLLTIDVFTIDNAGFAVYISLVCTTFVYLIYFRPKFKA
jgi:hypothetical protein